MNDRVDYRLTDLEKRMGDTEKLLRDTALLVNTQALQMGIVWGAMKLGSVGVFLAVLGLVLSAAFGQHVDVGGLGH